MRLVFDKNVWYTWVDDNRTLLEAVIDIYKQLNQFVNQGPYQF